MANEKKIFLLLFLVLFLSLNANLTFALEINYPPVPGATAPQDFIKTASPAEIPGLFVQYAVNLIIWLSGLIALGVFVYAGFLYLTSSGKPDKISSAKEQMSAAFFGLLILFCSFLVLKTLNPAIITPQIKVPPPIEVVNIPGSPPYPNVDKFFSAIDTELPFGTIIEKYVLETKVPKNEEGKRKARMERIKDIGKNNVELAMILKQNSEQLKNLVGQCSCDQAEPLCTEACEPMGSTPILDGLGPEGLTDFNNIVDDISKIAGPENLFESFQLNDAIVASLKNPADLSNAFESFGDITNFAKSTVGLDQLFGAAADIANIAATDPRNLTNLFGSINEATKIWGGDLSGIIRVIQPVQEIINNPDNLGGILGSVNHLFSEIPGAPDLTNLRGLNILSIGNSVQEVISDPADIGTILGSVNQITGQFGKNLGDINGINVLGIGSSLQGIMESPDNMGDVLFSINSLMSEIPGTPNLNNIRGINVLSLGNSIQSMMANSGNIDGVLSSVNSLMSQLPNSPNLTNLKGVNVLRIGNSLQGIINNKENFGEILISFNRLLTGIPGAPNLNNVRGVNVVNIVTPVQSIMNDPADLNVVFPAINQISLRAGGKDIGAALRVANNISGPLYRIRTSPYETNNVLESVNEIFSAVDGPNLSNVSGVNVLDIVSPFQEIRYAAFSGRIDDLMISANQVTGDFGINLENINGVNVFNIIDFVGNIKAETGSGDIGGLMESINQLTGVFGVDLRNIGGTNIMGIMSPVEGIMQGARTGDIGGLMVSLNQMTGNFGVNLADIGGINIMGIMSPVEGIMQGARTGDINGLLGSVNMLTGKFGFDLTNVNGQNMINIIQPFGNLIRDPWNTNNINAALQNLSQSFPGLENLEGALGEFQAMANIVKNPADFANIMNSAAALSEITPEQFGKVLGDLSQLNSLGPIGQNIMAAFIGGSCTCDPCRNPRPEIQKTEQKNLEAIYLGTQINQIDASGKQTTIKTSLVSEQNKAYEEIKLLKEELGKLENAQKNMLACPLTQLASLDEYLLKKEIFLNRRWFSSSVNFWRDIVIDNDWATFYCLVSGSISEPFPFSSIKKDLAETDDGVCQKNSFLGSLGMVALAQTTPSGPTQEKPFACSIEVPIGEIIDRTERIGYKIIERLEKLISLDEQLIKAVDKLHSLVSQCTSQVPRCRSVCIPIYDDGDLVGCIKRCVGSPCPYSEIDEQVEVINRIVQRRDANSSEGIKDVVEASQTQSNPNNPNNKALIEQVGLTTIIEKTVPELLKDLGKSVRNPMKECSAEAPEGAMAVVSDVSSHLLNCLDAVRNIGPEGMPIENCCFTEPLFNQCLDECYLEAGQFGKEGTLYKKCLTDCLNIKAKQINSKDLPTCRHLINFYCCGI